MINLKSNKKYLLLIPLVVSLIMLTFFSTAYDEIVREKHSQQYHSIQISVNLVASQIDRFVAENDDWATYDYVSVMEPMIEAIDALPMVYAELFDHDLNPLSTRIVEDSPKPFSLFEYPECVSAIKESVDHGELIVEFDDGTHQPYDMYLYFKKVPSGGFDNKCVVVIGLGKYAIEDNFAPWLVWGVMGLVSVTLVLQIWMILYISKLSDAERLAKEVREKKAGGKTCN